MRFDVENRPRQFAIEHVFDMLLFLPTHFDIQFFKYPRWKHHDVERYETEEYNTTMSKWLEVVDSLKKDSFIRWFHGLSHRDIV